MSGETVRNTGSAETPYRSGFVAIVGRPNVGKSTLLNQLLGEKIAIVTPKPQTTRNRVRGIKTMANAQIVFLDTPGIHRAHSMMNRRMVETALKTLDEVDCVFWLVDASTGIGRDDEDIARTLSRSETATIIVLNKVDSVAKGKLLPLMERLAELLPGREIVPVSALKGEGVALLLDLIIKQLPEGPRYYPEE